MMKKIFLFFVTLFIINAAYAQEAAEMINRANEALKANKFAEAFELYDKAMSNLGGIEVDKAINFNIGYAAMQAEKSDAAMKYFDKAIEAGTNVSKCHEYKGNIYNKLQDYPNALLSYEKALETSADKPGALYMNAAITAVRLQQNDKALGYFDKAYEAGFRQEDALLNKAMVLRKLNKNDEVKQTLITAAEKFPENKKIIGTLAGVYVAEGNNLYKGGVTILNAANKLVNDGKLKTDDPGYKTELEKAKAEFSKAVEVLNLALKYDPANQNAQTIIKACNQIK